MEELTLLTSLTWISPVNRHLVSRLYWTQCPLIHSDTEAAIGNQRTANKTANPLDGLVCRKNAPHQLTHIPPSWRSLPRGVNLFHCPAVVAFVFILIQKWSFSPRDLFILWHNPCDCCQVVTFLFSLHILRHRSHLLTTTSKYYAAHENTGTFSMRMMDSIKVKLPSTDKIVRNGFCFNENWLNSWFLVHTASIRSGGHTPYASIAFWYSRIVLSVLSLSLCQSCFHCFNC